MECKGLCGLQNHKSVESVSLDGDALSRRTVVDVLKAGDRNVFLN